MATVDQVSEKARRNGAGGEIETNTQSDRLARIISLQERRARR